MFEYPAMLGLSDALNAVFANIPDDRSSSIAYPAFGRLNRYSQTWKSSNEWNTKLIQPYLYTLTMFEKMVNELFTVGARYADSERAKLKSCLSRLQELADDTDAEPVSNEANKTAADVLAETFNLMGAGFLVPLIGADEQGGIGLTWRHCNKTVRAVFPPRECKEPFLYYRENSKYGILDTFSVNTLTAWLRWLTQDERISSDVLTMRLFSYRVPSITETKMLGRSK
jgi:hypothetical protein